MRPSATRAAVLAFGRRFTDWLTERRAVGLIVGAAAAIHLVALASLPLMVTPDGQYYLTQAAVSMGEVPPGQTFKWDAPGLPTLLELTFVLFGRNPVAIAAVQHALGVVTIWLVGRAACALAGPRWGLLVGLIALAEPWSLVWTTYVTTEALATALVAGAAALLLSPRRGWPGALAVGILSGAAFLTRPATLALAPFFLLSGVVGSRGGWRRTSVVAAAALAGMLFLPVCSKVLVPAKPSGGTTQGAGLQLFWGEGMFGMLDRGYLTDPRLLAIYDRTIGNETIAVKDERIVRFLYDSGAFDSPITAGLLRQWALDSIRQRPMTYVDSTLYTSLWLLNIGIPERPPMFDELSWLTERVFRDGRTFGQAASNFQGASLGFPGATSLAVDYRGDGPLKPYLMWWSRRHACGYPHLPLAAGALGALVLGLRRRNWGLALVVTGSFAYVAAHCLLLSAATRYTSTIMPIWYMTLATVLAAVTAQVRHRRRSCGRAAPGHRGPLASTFIRVVAGCPS